MIGDPAPVALLFGDALGVLRGLPDQTVDCCVTSPPYWGMRSYLPVDHPLKGLEIGTEKFPEEYVAKLVAVFSEVRRVLRPNGVLWVNLGDCYATGAGGAKKARGGVQGERWAGADCQPNRMKLPGLRRGDLVGVPWRVAFALQADGWILRQDVVWDKPACMPESVHDRCTRAHESVFMFTRTRRYWYDAQAIAEPAVTKDRAAWTDRGSEKQRGHGRKHTGFNGRYAEKVMRDGAPRTRNRRSVWRISTVPYAEAHFAVMPPKLAELCVLAGCPRGGVVLDPFGGSGTVGSELSRLVGARF